MACYFLNLGTAKSNNVSTISHKRHPYPYFYNNVIGHYISTDAWFVKVIVFFTIKNIFWLFYEFWAYFPVEPTFFLHTKPNFVDKITKIIKKMEMSERLIFSCDILVFCRFLHNYWVGCKNKLNWLFFRYFEDIQRFFPPVNIVLWYLNPKPIFQGQPIFQEQDTVSPFHKILWKKLEPKIKKTNWNQK